MEKQTTAERIAETYAPMVFSRAELLESGSTGADITRAVKVGALLRLRRDHYAHPDIDDRVAEAVRIGGRVACITLLEMVGVFVLRSAGLHMHVHPHMSRIRKRKSRNTVMHWSHRMRKGGPRHVVSVRDAVLQAILCQEPRAAIATLDSVLHLRLATRIQLEELFMCLPSRLHTLLKLVDASAESGSETYMRLILRTLGLRFETQVTIPGVGRVDFVVEGWLIIECDSKEFHAGWDKQVEDRTRDIAAAQLGYATVRPIAADILFDTSTVRQQIAGIIEAFGPRMRVRRAA
ncbi:endonuclease domain-containing protein [Microbacterium sp. KHB019]|uniref:endonuclease domain-containing protein n=1 Tax=Microbacterium sp. KHB019 TaxID=3129770 RepID=UPI00307971D5